MPSKKETWTTISLTKLTGILDTRSRPAENAAGAFRWKESMSVSPEGKLCTRDGFARAFSDLLFDNNGVLLTAPGPHTGVVYKNPDWHHRGRTRLPITFEFESTDTLGKRRFFAGTQAELALLDESAGTWTDLLTGLGAFGSYWQAAEMNDQVLFTNGVNPIQAYDINAATIGPISDLGGGSENIQAAKVVVQFAGFIFLMNIKAPDPNNGNAVGWRPTTVQWCDYGLPLSWVTGGSSVAACQDLPYGDEILASKVLLGQLYIFTRRSIIRCNVASAATVTFDFQQVYTEPKNQVGCLTYPRTLVSDGQQFWYATRDGWYRYSPYLAAPVRDDWLNRADGVAFKNPIYAMNGANSMLPCAEYRPTPRELWFSWPALNNPVNTMTLVAMLEQQTADVVRHGFTCFANYRRNPAAGVLSNEGQDFVAASGTDYSLKDIGQVFYYELLQLSNHDPSIDLPASTPGAVYLTVGYIRQIRGLIPTGLYDRNKIISNVLLDHDSTAEINPPVVKLRIGNSYNNCDPNDPDDSGCAPQWREFPVQALACPDGQTLSSMKAKNLKPSLAMQWRCYESNRFLYFELTIQNKDGSPAIGGDSCCQRLDFLVMAEPQSNP